MSNKEELECLHNEAVISFEDGNYDVAIEKLEKAVVLFEQKVMENGTEGASLYYYSAVAHGAKGNFGAAKRYWIEYLGRLYSVSVGLAKSSYPLADCFGFNKGHFQIDESSKMWVSSDDIKQMKLLTDIIEYHKLKVFVKKAIGQINL